MKKYVKRTVLLAAAVIAVGVIAVLAGLGALGFDVYALDSAEYKEKLITEDTLGEENSAATVTKMEADLSNLTINFERGEKFGLSYYLSDDFEVNCDYSAETGVFKVKAREKIKSILSLNFFKGIKRHKLSFTFIVPDGIDIDTTCTNSSVNVSSVKVDSLKMHGSNATVALNETQCETFSFSGSNTSFKVYGSSFGTLSFGGANASVKISTTEIDKAEFVGNNASFDISLRGVKEDYASIGMSGNNASFRFCGERVRGGYKYDGIGGKTFSAQGNNASIKLNFEG